MPQRKISDYKPDPVNANTGTERGQYMIEQSLGKLGAGRSVVSDKNGYLIAGNKTWETAGALGIEDVIEVESDGRQLVVVRRTDLDLLSDEDRRGRELAYADNRVSEVNLAWDADQIMSDMAEGLELTPFFHESELQAFSGQAEIPEDGRGRDLEDDLERFLNSDIRQIVLLFGKDEYEAVIRRLDIVAERESTEDYTALFLRLLGHYEETTR